MLNAFNNIEIAVSIILSLCILLQHRASGLSSTFGGSGVTFVQRRGAEKLIYKSSIWLSAVFLTIPVIQWFIY